MFDIQQHTKNRLNHIYNSFYKAKTIIDSDLVSVVAIVLKGNKVLLGKATNKDERLGKLCFPGGKIDKGESIYEAVMREVEEESGIICQSKGDPVIKDKNLKGVGFIICNYISGILKENWEFESGSMKWFDIKNLPKDILEVNRKIIEKYLL